MDKINLAAVDASREESEAYAAREAAKRSGTGSPRNSKSGTTEPVVVPRRNAKTPRGTGPPVVFSWQKRAVVAERPAEEETETTVSDLPPIKSPRRMGPNDKLARDEQMVMDLFKRLNKEAQARVLDALEDFMDEEDEKERYRAAAEEERKIKQSKLEALKREEEERRRAAEAKRRALEEQAHGIHAAAAVEREQALREQRAVVQPSVEEAKRQKEVEAEIARLRHLEAEEKRKIHELEVQLKEQATGQKIGAHGAADRDATNPNVDTSALEKPFVSDVEEKLLQRKPALRKITDQIAALEAQRAGAGGAAAPGALPVVAPIPAPRRGSLISVSRDSGTRDGGSAAPAAAAAPPAAAEVEVKKSRNPKLASMMALMSQEPDNKSGAFGFAATPDVPRLPTQKSTVGTPAAPVPATTNTVSDDDVMNMMRAANRPNH